MAAFAVWVAVLAPTVSRTAQSCVFPELSALCGQVSAGHEHHHRHEGGHHDDGEGACGYCTLFARTPSLGGMVALHRMACVAAPPPDVRPVTPGFVTLAFPRPPSQGPPAVA